MTVNEIIKLLDKEENKYGGATGKERELNLSVNGDFVGTITRAKLDGWGDDLVTDVTLEVEVASIKYHDEKIRNEVIDEFTERLKENSIRGAFEYKPNKKEPWHKVRAFCRVVGMRKIDKIAEEMRGAE